VLVLDRELVPPPVQRPQPRGLMLIIKREIRRLGGETRDFPVGGRAHLGDV